MASTNIEIEEVVSAVRILPRGGQEEADASWFMKHENLSKSLWTLERLLRGYNVTYAELEEADFYAARWLYNRGHATIRFRENGKDSIEETWVKGELMDELEDSFYFFANRQSPRLWRDNAISGFVNMVADNLRKIDDFMTAP
jgi:hypothetical protein